MFIGEAKRHPEAALQVLRGVVLPLREKLIVYLGNGIEQGNVRPEVDLQLTVDMFTGMLLSGMLRRHTSRISQGYSRDRYVESCVDLFVRGISTLPGNNSSHSSTLSDG